MSSKVAYLFAMWKFVLRRKKRGGRRKEEG